MSQPLISLYLDVDRPGGGPCRLQALGTPDLDASRIPLTSIDLAVLRVYFRTFVDVAAGADWQKSAGATIDATLVAESSLLGSSAPAIIYHLTPLTPGGSTNHYYTGTLNLAVVAVAIALDSVAEVACILDIAVTEALTRATYRVPCILRRSTQGTPPS